MEKKQNISTKRIVTAALMAALVAVGSALRITLPLDVGGNTSFHLGNIFCALSGILLGPWVGGLAAGLGSAIYDMFNPLYIDEAWITFITKGAYGMAAGTVAYVGANGWGYARATAATVAGALVYALLYLAKSFFYGGMLKQGLAAAAAWIVVIEKLPATVFNAAVAILFAPLLATAIRTALKKNHLTLE